MGSLEIVWFGIAGIIEVVWVFWVWSFGYVRSFRPNEFDEESSESLQIYNAHILIQTMGIALQLPSNAVDTGGNTSLFRGIGLVQASLGA